MHYIWNLQFTKILKKTKLILDKLIQEYQHEKNEIDLGLINPGISTGKSKISRVGA